MKRSKRSSMSLFPADLYELDDLFKIFFDNFSVYRGEREYHEEEPVSPRSKESLIKR